MNNWRFVITSVIIFAARYVFSIIWPVLWQVDVFAIWALAIFFLEKNQRVHGVVFLMAVIFFDFWSGSSFGTMSLALVFTALTIFVIKKIMLLEDRSFFSSLIWLIGFYYLNVFIQNGLSDLFYKNFTFPQFHILGIIITISWIVLMMLIVKIINRERISSFRLRR